jgi:hypothetical protein
LRVFTRSIRSTRTAVPSSLNPFQYDLAKIVLLKTRVTAAAAADPTE